MPHVGVAALRASGRPVLFFPRLIVLIAPASLRRSRARLLTAPVFCDRSDVGTSYLSLHVVVAGAPGGDPNIPDLRGTTPLIIASQNGRAAVVKELVSRRAEVNVWNEVRH